MNNVYHESRNSIYFDNGDGSLTVKHKTKVKEKQTLARFKNNEQGRSAYKQFRRTLGTSVKTYILYRCPNTGKTYDEENNCRKFPSFSRRGSVKKTVAKIMCVLQKTR